MNPFQERQPNIDRNISICVPQYEAFKTLLEYSVREDHSDREVGIQQFQYKKITHNNLREA